MNQAQETIDILLSTRAIELSFDEPFLWASGIVSPIYCDHRRILSYPDGRKKIVEFLSQKIKDTPPVDAIVGTATAGIPWGAMLASQMNLPFLYVRSSPKRHGKAQSIEGDLRDFKKVILIEDLISTGGSSSNAAQLLKEAKLEVISILSIFSYGLKKAEQKMSELSLNYQALATYQDLKEKLFNNLSARDQKKLQSWHDQINELNQ